MKLKEQLDRRYELTMDEYDKLLIGNNAVKFGTRNVVLNTGFLPKARTAHGSEALFLTEIKEFGRQYQHLSV
jgi:polyketide biosynthesis 3-hydroxy-3-methylglutaryl-CoA synthase-like enzyme PksG